MRFLRGDELHQAIREIAGENEVCCAVAFWGTGAKMLFPEVANRNIQIICNLKMGGTNPLVIEEIRLLKGLHVKQHDTLHAKVYIAEKTAIVTSANASANGLGFEGREQATWEEAGILTNDTETMKGIRHWFAVAWEESREISGPDIERAKIAWNARQASKPSLKSIAAIELNATNIPLISWYGDWEWDVNPELKKDRTPDAFEILESRIDDGVYIEGPEDREVLTPGTWVLYFKRTRQGLPDRRVGLSWVQVGPILDRAFRFRDEKELQAVALAAEYQGQEPFPIRGSKFFDSFFDLISRPEFQELCTVGYEGAWFTGERLRLIREFWLALRDRVAVGNNSKRRAPS